jgi:uncharacterized protein YceH (UPF0502 family)
VTNLSEEQVLAALDALRSKELAHEVMLSGSRVQKFRHVAREALNVDTNQLVILTELLLRGPQTLGELRGRASRMHPLETTDIVKNILDSLMQRSDPLVRELPAAPGDRAVRFAQLLCPDLHPLDAVSSAGESAQSRSISSVIDEGLLARIENLEREVAHLRAAVDRMAHSTHSVSGGVS